MKIQGKVATIIFKNEENSWTVLLIKSGKEYITAVGETSDIEVDDELEFEGEETNHKVYGKQFAFSTYKKTLPKTNKALIEYIANNVKGIGKKTAKHIVDKFGEETPNIARFNKSSLLSVKGLNDEKVDELNIFFSDEWEKWNIIEFLSQFNISVVVASSIYKALGTDTIDIVKQNPYSLLVFVKTLDFEFVDEIAKKLGISNDSEERINAGLIYAMNKKTEFGHTCVLKDEFISFASQILNVREDIVTNGIKRLELEQKLYIQNIDDEENIFRRSYYLAEENIASNIVSRSTRFMENRDYSKHIEAVSKANDIVLSTEQDLAISTCLNSSISVITGGPGTGKTTIIKCIIDILEMIDKKYVLCAPTGRAAKRITEMTKKHAKTIHRLLEIQKVDDRDLDAMYELDVKTVDKDVIIIDEASMIDTLMMNNLFKAIKDDSKIILVGDINQLPSVGAGNVLKDIIASNVVNVVSLKEIYRQSQKSDIILNAHRVNNGEVPEFKNNNTDMFFVPTNSIEDTTKQLSDLISFRLKKYAEFDTLKDLQLLTPMKKTELGTIHLNQLMQELLNPKKSTKNEKKLLSRVFREGDKVMQILNNYDKKFSVNGEFFDGVFNGEIGFITKIDKDEETLTVVFDDEKEVVYDFDELDQLEHAYAVTVHKSQGSEFDYVVLPLYAGYPKLFTRNLLYTAMTRAKKMLVIVGSKNVITYMVKNIDSKNRRTGLKEKIVNKL